MVDLGGGGFGRHFEFGRKGCGRIGLSGEKGLGV